MSELMHYGTPRHSGRYPWGSGDNPYQHEPSFLESVRKLEDQALPIPICKYFWAFVGMVIALVVTLKMYGKA